MESELEFIPELPGIYLIICKINGKPYVGKANNLRTKPKDYTVYIKTKSHQKRPIIKAIKTYGLENFTFKVLESFEKIDSEDLLKKEEEWIKTLKSLTTQGGYNVCAYSHDRTGCYHTEETKQKISKTKIERNSQKISPLIGHKHSQESKKKMSESAKKRFSREPHPMKGKPKSEETKEKLRQSGLKQDFSFKKKPVKQINLTTLEVIKVWSSGTEAARELKMSSADISNVCLKKIKKNGYPYKSAKGFLWEFVN